MINLLPPRAKQNLRREALSRQLAFVGEASFLLCVFFALLLLGEVFFANAKLRKLSYSIQAATARPEVQQVTQFQQRLRLLKNDVDRARRIQEQHPESFTTIRQFIALLPPAIGLTSLDVNLTEKRIVFAGISPTRADLLALKDTLEKNGSYADINFPLANLLKETHISFTISAIMKAPPAL